MGSSPDSAQREATAAEAARKAQVAQSVGAIESLFSSPDRQKQYADFLGAKRQLYTTDVNRQQDINNRQLKFSLARNGQSGSSLSRDQGERAGQDYNRGLIEAERSAQGDEAALRGQDQQSRLTLLGMAQSGADATTGASNAALMMKNNLDAGKATSNVQQMGDVFKNYADFYRKSQESKALRQGQQFAYNTLYQPGLYSGYPAK